MDEKIFEYLELKDDVKPENLQEDINLYEIYGAAERELALQQNKRDQLIAFYLTICGVAISFAFSSSVLMPLRTGILLFLFVLGAMWCSIIARYKIYKEAYWITCRTLNHLFTYKKSEIGKARIQHIFYTCMYKNFKDNLKDDSSIDMKKLIKGNLKSAEFLMYMTLALLAGISGSLSVLSIFVYLGLGALGYALAAVAFAAYLLRRIYVYNKEIAKFYRVVSDKTDKSFNDAFKKAWHLHIF